MVRWSTLGFNNVNNNVEEFIINNSNVNGFENPNFVNRQYVIQGLAAGTSYSITVSSTNMAGTSAASFPAAQCSTINVPGAPTVQCGVQSANEIPVSWIDSLTTGGSAITQYRVTWQL